MLFICRCWDTYSTWIRGHIHAKVVSYWRLLLFCKIVWSFSWVTLFSCGQIWITLSVWSGSLSSFTVMEHFIYGRQTRGPLNLGRQLVVLSRWGKWFGWLVMIATNRIRGWIMMWCIAQMLCLIKKKLNDFPFNFLDWCTLSALN